MIADPSSTPPPDSNANSPEARGANPILARAEAMQVARRRQLAEMERRARDGGKSEIIEILPPQPVRQLEAARELDIMRRRARRLIYTGDEETPPRLLQSGISDGTRLSTIETRKAEDPLAKLSPRAMHRIEAALGRVRHSAVESCFYNLKLYAGMLAADRTPADFERKLGGALAGLDEAQARIITFLDDPIEALETPRSVFSAESSQIMQGLETLRGQRAHWSATDAPSPTVAHTHDAQCGRALEQGIEQVSGALARMQGRLDARRIGITEVIESAAQQEMPRLDAAGIALNVDIELMREARLYLDRASLSDAISEALRNVVKHGFDAIAASPHQKEGRTVHITGGWAKGTSRVARVEIRDDGRGIEPSFLAELGQRGATTAAARGGSGEGLALIRRVVEEEHLGRLAIESEPGKGTTLIIEIPMKADLKRIGA